MNTGKVEKTSFAIFVAASLVLLLSACGSVATDSPGGGLKATAASDDDPLKILSLEMVETEIRRIDGINQTLDGSAVDTSEYPKVIGVDLRNGLVLVEDYFCWDICPDIGTVLLAYEDVDTPGQCADAGGRAVYAPTPVPGPYAACRAQGR